MAEPEANHSTETLGDEGTKDLKYLDFVQNAVIYFVVSFSAVYDYAKENSGPLKPGVHTIENTVKTVIGPVYEKFHNVPSELLKFLDRKVEDTLKEVNQHMPSVIKHVSNAAQKSPEIAREIQRDGLFNTALNLAKTIYEKFEPTAKGLYTTYEPVAEKHVLSAWQTMNRLPLFPQVAHVVVPTAAYWAEKYNQAVGYTAEKGYPVAQYLPLVPVEKIAKVFKEEGESRQEIMIDT